jgi:hypothetical protein
VPGPELYRWYAAEEAISFFGSPDEAQRLCNDQWLIFPATVVCMAEIGEAPKRSHFEKGSRFCWVADQPYQVNDKRGWHLVPAQAVGSEGRKYSIRLFVRPPQARDYLCAGELGPSNRAQSGGREHCAAAWFDLKPTLASSVWLELGGLRPGDFDFAAVDQALDRLKCPTTIHDSLEILRSLVNFWHGPIRPEDGMNDAEIGGVQLPLPLRWWYRWAGKREEVMSRQNFLFVPRDWRFRHHVLHVRKGSLNFYVENQGVYQWSTLPDGDDPPVFGRYECRGRWAREGVRLSEHLILACLFKAIICHARYGAWVTWLDEDSFNLITRTIPPLAIAPWRWCGTRFFAGRGAFMCATENGEVNGRQGYSIHIGAKTEHPLQFLKPYLDDRWEYVAV